MEQNSFQFATDPSAAIDKLVDDVLCGRVTPGWPLPDPARELLRLLRHHRGVRYAKPLAAIAEKLGMQAREVKSTVKSLIEDFGIPIGASRQEPYGYFLCVTPEDYDAAERPLINEMLSIATRLRALGGEHRLNEVMGQLKLELEKKAG
ncbi:MAG TPA: hypothetical protein VN622_08990 [Clostridia bacterium]|nr:hypothetical protein [Clostridia bacterium]